jgi:hypothetical protein
MYRLIDEMNSRSAFPFAFSANFHYLCCVKQLGRVAPAKKKAGRQSAEEMADFASSIIKVKAAG